MENEFKAVPTGVKLISIVYYIGSGLTFLLALVCILGGLIFASALKEIPIISSFGSILFVVFGLIFIGLGLLQMFIGKALWHGKKWARIFVVIFAVLSLISGLITVISGASSQLLGKIIYGFITLGFNAWLLIFILLSQESKHYFS